MANLFAGKQLQRKEGAAYKPVDAAEALNGKVVALYFSAHWCPPCRHFTPLLKDFYNELRASGEPLEIVFLSMDESEAQLKAYLQEAHGDWCFLPLGDALIEELSDKFGVEGIPTLVVLKTDGTVAVEDGRDDVENKGPVVFKTWKTAAGL